MAFKATGAGLRNFPARAIVYMLTASFLIIILDTAVKWLAKGYSPLQIGFVRYVIGLGVAMAIATPGRGPRHASHPAHRRASRCAPASISPPC